MGTNNHVQAVPCHMHLHDSLSYASHEGRRTVAATSGDPVASHEGTSLVEVFTVLMLC